MLRTTLTTESGSHTYPHMPQAARVDTVGRQQLLLPLSAPLLGNLIALNKLGPAPTTAFLKRGGQLNPEGRRYPLALRLGAMVSPRTKFVGGVDLTLPTLGFGPDWVGRVDAEAIVSANLGGVTTVVPLTFNEVYYAPERTGTTRLYAGAGIGPYFGEYVRFGGKLFIGANFTPHVSGEVDLQFSGSGRPLVTAMVRFPL
jgi:hypothetical protein